MRQMRKFAAAIVLAGVIGVVMNTTAQRVEAKGKSGGGDIGTVCAALAASYANYDSSSLIAQLILAAEQALGC